MRRPFRSGMALAVLGIMVHLQRVTMATTHIIHTLAHLTATTALIGSPAGSSSGPARGTATMAGADSMADAAITAEEATTAVAGITVGVAGSRAAAASEAQAQLVVDHLVGASEEAPRLGALEAVASRVAEVHAVGEASAVEAAHAVAAGSTAEAADAVEDTGK